MTDSAIARRDRVARRRVRPQVGHGDLGRERRRRRERADVLRGLIRRARARLPEPLDERVEEVGRHLVADLDLELPECGGGAAVAVRHGDGVVDDPGDEPPAGVVHLGAAADRRHVHALGESTAANERAHELDRARRRAVAVAVEHDLGTHEERRVALGRELDRPALSGAVAEARTPAREAQVRGVVVRRLVALGGAWRTIGPTSP